MAQSPHNDITSSLSYQYMSGTIYVVSGGLFYIFIAKFLPTYTVGAVSLLLAIVALLTTFFSFAFPTSAQHFISFHIGKKDYAETHSLALRLVWISVLLSLASIAFTLLAAKPLAILFFHNSADTILVDIASIYVAISVMFGVLHGTALGFQMFRTDAFIYLSSASASYFVGLAFLFVLHSIFYLVVGLTLSYFYGSIFYVIKLFSKRRTPWEPSRKTTTQLIFSYSWPLVLSGLLGYGSSYGDRILVAYFLNLDLLGIYSFVLIVSTSLYFLGGPIVNVLFSKLSEFYSTGDKVKLVKAVNLSSTLLMLIYPPVALGVASISPIVLSLLAQPVYSIGYVALTIVLGSSSIFVLGSVVSSVLSAVRKTRVYILSTASTLASNVILSVLLIPRFEMLGAAIAYSSVFVISFVINYYYAITKEVGGFDWVTVLKIWSSSVIMFVMVSIERFVFGNFVRMLPLYILTGALFYLISLNLTRSMKRIKRDEFLSYLPMRFGFRRIAGILLSIAF